VAERDRHAPVGEEALDVVDPIGSPVDLDQAAKGAAPDPLRGEPVCLGVGFDDGQMQGQGHRVVRASEFERYPRVGRAA
jgi:hypothetical protein